jgi:thiol-disulfide isomerase/thioredoxin
MWAVRVAAHRDLAIALRDGQQYEKAAKQATGGFEIGRRIPSGDHLSLQLREARDSDTPRLAAMAVDLLERIGQKKVAEEIAGRWRLGERDRPPQAQLIYETELTSARLIGRPVPELAAKRWLDSSPLTLGALRGKVILLHFWAMWNGASASQFPRLREVNTAYTDRGLQVIGVTRIYGRSDTEDGLSAKQELQSLESFKRKQQITFPFAVGGQDDITDDETFGVASLPMIILIDRQGRVRQIRRGASEYRKLPRQIDKLISEP